MRNLPPRALLLALLTLGAAAGPAAAQARLPALRMGEPVQVTISASDPALTGWGRYRAYRFEAHPDRVYRITASGAPGMGPRLRLARQSGPLTDYLAEAGDDAEGDTLRLRFRAPEAGPYLVVVSADSGGVFTLVADELAGRAPAPRPLPLGTVFRGEMSDESGITVEDGTERVYELFTFRARAGQALAVIPYDAFSYRADFGQLRDGRFVGMDGDSTGPARVVRVPADGEYAVRLSAELAGAGNRPYALRVADVAVRPEPRAVRLESAATGIYDPAAAYPGSGPVPAPADEWVFSGTAGQELSVSVSSDTFDTYVSVGRWDGTSYTELASDDDTGDRNNSLVERLTLPETGEYMVRVSAFGSDVQLGGPYTLLVRSVRQAVGAPRRGHPETRPIRVGTTVTGTLAEGDAMLEDGSLHDAWTFSAAAGQRVTLTLASRDFDAYLAVGVMDEGRFLELRSNDDAPGAGTDARVVMVAPESGQYVIRVNALVAGQAGRYELTAEAGRPPASQPSS